MAERPPSEAERDRSFVRAALFRFFGLSLAALLVLGLGIVVVSRHIARDEAIRDARVRTAGMARGIAAPLVNEAVRAREPGAVDALADALEHRMRDGSVAHIHVWNRDGLVLWSDVESQVGQHYELKPEVRALFETPGTVSMTSRLDQEENDGMEEDWLLEVYVGAFDSEGAPFVLEGYFTPSRIAVDADAIFIELLPLGLGALLVFQLTILPLAYSLARRVERGRQQRLELLSRSMASWHLERRRLAQDLHDGVIQHLAAASYALPTVLASLPDGAVEAHRVGEQVNELMQGDLRALRSLVMDLLPSDLTGAGLVAAINELARGATDEGVEVRVSVAPALDLSAEVAGAVYRVVREGLRNAARHADAHVVEVTVTADGETAVVRVLDDGVGPGSTNSAHGHHVGLRLLSGMVADLGGTVSLDPRPGGGTRLEARLPVAWAD